MEFAIFFAEQMLIATLIIITGCIASVFVILSTFDGRLEARRWWSTWRFKRYLRRENRSLKNRISIKEREVDYWQTKLVEYAEEDIRLTQMLYQHMRVQHTTIFDEVVFDHGFNPLESTNMEYA